MSDEIVIAVEGLGKRYRIRHEAERYTALRDVIAARVMSPVRALKAKFERKEVETGNGSESEISTSSFSLSTSKENRSSDLSPLSSRTSPPRTEDFWALRDVSFEVRRGEVLGIIGRNGAGKTTLLKILSRITEPTEGRVRLRGRVASLLEVGTGFHPELTGRENIYLNGAILGMSRAEIKKKFDEIVAFAETEKFLDTPVKRYSSGMYVRLAFAVAAHLEPEILVVDEVLAVGDAEFQKKCLGKMQDVSTKEGRTVLFVSHNMAAVKSLCPIGLWLETGKIIQKGSAPKVVDEYLGSSSFNNTTVNLADVTRPSWCGNALRIRHVCINEARPVRHGESFSMSIEFECYRKISDVSFGIGFSTVEGARLLSFDSDFQQQRIPVLERGRGSCQVNISQLHLQPARYSLDVGARSGDQFPLDYLAGALQVDVQPGSSTPHHIIRAEGGVRMPSAWVF